MFDLRLSFILLALLVNHSHGLPSSSGTTSASAALPSGTSTVDTDTAAKAAGKLYFGTATNAFEFQSDEAYAEALGDNKLFGAVTPANALKWVNILL